ncbi:MAG: hypothetical protein GC190_12305 [Alphaproteobacteria bacterium]|nr:hypothetical protein [Alphaproteobacteria bacterium]
MSRRCAFLQRFFADRRGATVVLYALSLPALVGFTGLGVEVGYWYYKQRELQTAADVAAYAGAIELRGGSSSSEVYSASLSEATTQGFAPGSGSIVVNTPPTSGTHQTNKSVEVLLTQDTPRLFSAIYDSKPVPINARGVATYEDGGQACLLALDPNASGAVTFTGNALMLMNGCNVMSNSLSDSSLIVNGSADVTVPCALAAGGIAADNGLKLTQCSEAQSNVPPANDPFKNLPAPPTSLLNGPCLTAPSGNGAATLTPGRYCGGLSLKGDKTFAPGTYVIDGGDFSINATANVAGAGVTFYMTNSATVKFNGTADIDFSAPTSGTYEGVLFYGDRNSPDVDHKFNGNASSKMTGSIYFPSQTVEFLGNFSGSNGCMRIVARAIDFTGSSTLNSDCTAYGINNMPLPGKVTLVE